MRSFHLSHRFRSALLLLLLPILVGGAPPSKEAVVTACDNLASHPHDPGRHSAPVTDDQFAPGAAIEACERATQASPDLARLWFELGRSYWIATRDKEAFLAFVQAVKRDYAPAMKFIGDAYLEDRGLPTGERADINTALQWYQKSKNGGFKDADIAIKELNEELARNEFHPELFQNPKYISLIHSGNFDSIDDAIMFFAYVRAFTDELGGTNVFFIEPSCKPMITQLGTTIQNFHSCLPILKRSKAKMAWAALSSRLSCQLLPAIKAKKMRTC